MCRRPPGSTASLWPRLRTGKEKFLLGAENALCSKPRDGEALKDEQIKRLKQKVGELVLDMDILKEAQEGTPLRPGDVRRVRALFPQASERRVCRLLGVSRSAMLERSSRSATAPKVDDSLAGEIEKLINKPPTFGSPAALGDPWVPTGSQGQPEGRLPHPGS